jgi:WG containing repeat
MDLGWNKFFICLVLFFSHHLFGQPQEQALFPRRYSDGTYGYVNISGSYVITPRFHRAFPFFQGYARVQMFGNWGLINMRGEYLLKPKYQYVGWSDDPYFKKNKNWLHLANAVGVAGEYFFPPVDGRIGIIKDGKWYSVTPNGKSRSRGFDSLEHFSGGYAPVYQSSKKGWNFIDRTKSQVQTDRFYSAVKAVKCGLVGVRDSSDFFRVLNPGSMKWLKGEFEDISSINEIYWAAKGKTGWGVLEKNGTVLRPLEFRKITYLPFIKKIKLSPKNYWFVLNDSLKALKEFQLDTAYFLNSGELILQSSSKIEILTPDLRSQGLFEKNVSVERKGKYWLFSKGKAKTIFRNIPDFTKLEFPYDSIVFMGESILARANGETWIQLNEKLKPLWRFHGKIKILDDTAIAFFKDSCYIFYNLISGRSSISCYDQIFEGRDKYYYAIKKGKKGLLNSEGEEVLAPGPSYFSLLGGAKVASFGNGKIVIMEPPDKILGSYYGESILINGESSYLIRKNGKSKIINDSLRIILEGYSHISAQYNTGWVNIHGARGWSTYDLGRGEFLFSFSKDFDSLGVGSGPLIPAWIKGNRGFIDHRGILTISTQYQDLDVPHDGLFPFRIKNEWGLFDKQERFILQPRYDKVEFFGGKLWRILKDEKIGLFHSVLGMIIPPEMDNLSRNKSGKWLIGEKNGKLGLFNENGSQRLSFVYSDIKILPNGWFLTQKGNQWQILDNEFTNISPFRMDFISTNSLGYFLVQKKEADAYMDLP